MALDGVVIWAFEIRGCGRRRRTLDDKSLDRLRGGAGVVGLACLVSLGMVSSSPLSSSSSLSASSDELPPAFSPGWPLGDEWATGEWRVNNVGDGTGLIVCAERLP